jgi:hypothetical protein
MARGGRTEKKTTPATTTVTDVLLRLVSYGVHACPGVAADTCPAPPPSFSSLAAATLSIVIEVPPPVLVRMPTWELRARADLLARSGTALLALTHGAAARRQARAR